MSSSILSSIRTPLRKYQKDAVDLAKSNNAIVVLPTGSGKTLIAAATIHSIFIKNSNLRNILPCKSLFLVPTCLLVEQQSKAMRYETNLNIAEYMGGRATPEAYDVLVSTPAAFLILSDSNAKFRLNVFSLVVFDEVHHVLKRHPYRSIARRLSGLPEHSIQLLGLTATLSYAIHSASIERNIRSLLSELNVQADHVFTRTPEQLIADGYQGNCSATQLAAEDSMENSTIFEVENNAGVFDLEIPGKAHSALDDFLHFVRSGGPRIHPLSVRLMEAITSIEGVVKEKDAHFVTPIGKKGKQGKVSAWGEYAHKHRKLASSLALKGLYETLEHLYEAARLLVNSRQLSLELAFNYLCMVGLLSDDDGTSRWSDNPIVIQHLQELSSLWSECKEQLQFQRLDRFGDVIESQLERYGNRLRAIVFVQQRISTHIIQYYLNTHPNEEIRNLACDVIYATTSPATASFSVSSSQSRDRISRFARGQLSVLIATSVAEEGMDIPAANCVIRFDAILTPVSLVQSRGRARQEDSTFVVMAEAKDRSCAVLQEGASSQLALITTLAAAHTTDEFSSKKRKIAQNSRLTGAKPLINSYFSTHSGDSATSVSVLKLFCQKISGEVSESYKTANGGGWIATVSLSQFNASLLLAVSMSETKKRALQLASHNLLCQIRDTY